MKRFIRFTWCALLFGLVVFQVQAAFTSLYVFGDGVSTTTNNPAAPQRLRSPLTIEENWLTGVTPMLMADNTVTEITRTGPAELTVVRKSPFALTSLELVLLSHWLSGTGRPGVYPGLLPPPAKISGPGINPSSR